MKLKYLGMLLLLIVLAFLYFFINPNQVNFLPKCPLYKTTGIYCPGCGSQRATHQLLNFNIIGVFQQNALFVLGLLLIVYHLIVTGINYYFKKNYFNYIYHPKTVIVLIIITIIFWILRNIPFYPFTLLAPH
ncbi:DUF2752 domain-containing protein [Lutibacter sp. A64]|uniref:DUF2752 domain-containing protein n=1 Tax=Lutibacter sp. A64 TaxID=2918526 RepID=UPI001F06D7A7|nr:DUF2752 domain-containing protein [Lutibacter sp. A64]UMB54968.1 DUF2752 domain-containing protein [Lutibacter sp. A64]